MNNGWYHFKYVPQTVTLILRMNVTAVNFHKQLNIYIDVICALKLLYEQDTPKVIQMDSQNRLNCLKCGISTLYFIPAQ